ncbi:MAG: hypothetical protein H0V98_04295, partial [Chloroflexia bacterium]|nr:hypothetical protein [Chloroflexia bacterium]
MDAPHQPDRRRVVVIGPCASGKTTLTQRLRALGFDARACGQQHSEILELWKHMQPDVLIGLWIDLETLRDRRSSASWAGSIYARQQHRLASGYAHADLVIDCHDIDPDEVERDV